MRTAHNAHTSGVLNLILTADGRERHIRWSNSTLTDNDDEATSVLAIGVDVTELIAAQRFANRSQRLAAIGQTVAGLAHESRNALHRIQASVEILQLDIPPGTELREEVDTIQRASAELHKTLEEVRQYAAPIQLHRESASLPHLWRRVWGYLATTRKSRDAELIESDCGCECDVDIDVLRVEQLFRNLFENALAACSDPVRIHLNCKCDGSDWILLDIQDNGPGLTAEQRERLFEPFYTTKSRGTGLGMSIVQRIVDAHGGDIHIAQPNGQGARFVIRFLKHETASRTICAG
jgi:signal transduction histidine kinase